MIDFEKLNDIIWQYANDLLGIAVIRADQAGERPTTRPYLTFKILVGPTSIGQDEERVVSSTAEKVKLSNEGQRDLTISFNSFGTGAGQLMTKLQSILRSNLGREKLGYLARDKGIELSFIDSPTMQDLTSLIQSEYEERFQMDSIFRTVSVFEEELPFIEETIIDGNIKDQNGDEKAP